jgi:hypothetical protein
MVDVLFEGVTVYYDVVDVVGRRGWRPGLPPPSDDACR